MSPILPGDRVTMEHSNGSRLVTTAHARGNLEPYLPGFVINGIGWCSYETLLSEGWQVTEHSTTYSIPTTARDLAEELVGYFTAPYPFDLTAIVRTLRERYGLGAGL